MKGLCRIEKTRFTGITKPEQLRPVNDPAQELEAVKFSDLYIKFIFNITQISFKKAIKSPGYFCGPFTQ